VTANLANVLSRLNARTFWLIPLICAGIITATLLNWRDNQRQSTR
jgi:Mg/Co/Ni transporter MgtE